MVETALNSPRGVKGARGITKPESTLIWHSLHSLYLYSKLHQNENSNIPNCESKSNHSWTQVLTPARHFSAISCKSNFSCWSSVGRDALPGFSPVASVLLPFYPLPSLGMKTVRRTCPVAPVFLGGGWAKREGQAVYLL